MRIVCIGGGPAGLTFALLMKKLDPGHDITVVERNRPYDTFGWGVVFSDATMAHLRRWDEETAGAIEAAFAHWDDIVLEFKGRAIRSGGHGFVGIGRKRLLNILQARCESLGVKLAFDREVRDDAEFPDADLIVASDGINSVVRQKYADVFQPDIVTRPNRFIWLGTKKLYDAFTFVFERTEHGWFQAHVYKFDAETSTFIVECPEHVWLTHGLDKLDAEQSVAFCEQVFARHLQGAKLMTNARHLRGSAWLNFQRIKCEQWWVGADRREAGHAPVVLMGDAVHTAHFAIGSGTKLALEDAIELASQFKQAGEAGGDIALPTLLDRYQAIREVEVLRLQNAAWNAMEWFEVCGTRYCDPLEPEQFMYSLLTRSQRISHENLRLRDAGWLEGYERWFAQRGAALATTIEPADAVVPRVVVAPTQPIPPMFTPFTVRSITLKNAASSRLLRDGAVLGHRRRRRRLPPRAPGRPRDGRRGAGDGRDDLRQRRRPHHQGLPGPVHRGAGRRVGAHRRLGAHAQRRPHRHAAGPCRRQGRDASRLGRHRPAAGLRRRAADLGFGAAIPAGGTRLVARDDARRHGSRAAQLRHLHRAARPRPASTWLELHCAHGYLLSSFVSPLTNEARGRAYAADSLWRTGCAIRSRSSRRCARRGLRSCRCRCASPRTTGSEGGGIYAGRMPSRRSRVQGRGRRHDRLLVGPQVSKDEKPIYGRMSIDAVRRPRSKQRGPASRRSPSARSARPTTSTASSPPAVPMAVRRRAAAPGQPGVDTPTEAARIGLEAGRIGRRRTARRNRPQAGGDLLPA